MKKLKFRSILVGCLIILTSIPLIFVFFHIKSTKVILAETASNIIGAVEHAAAELKTVTTNSHEKTHLVPIVIMKDVVLGIIKDTDPKNVAVFAYSFRSVNREADIYFFINEPIPDQTKVIAQENEIILLPINTYSHFFSVKTIQNKFHPSTIRWPLMLAFLKQSNGLFKRILFIDVRDSYFQKDPFLYLPNLPDSRFFYVTTGVESILIKQCGWNGNWVKDCFSPEILHQIGGNNIICSGVTLTDSITAIDYLEKMTAIIMKSTLSSLDDVSNTNAMSISATSMNAISNLLYISKFPTCERNGVDQGVHNVLVHTNSIPNLKILKQSDGIVSNMQSKAYRLENNSVYTITSPTSNVWANSEVNTNTLFSIVHQYDRSTQLQKVLFKKYVKWVNTDDVDSEWKNDSVCGKLFTDPVKDKDAYKGRCDLRMQGGATSPVSCCKYCVNDSSNRCKSFVYLSGMCFLKSCKATDSNRNTQQSKIKFVSLPGAWSASRTDV